MQIRYIVVWSDAPTIDDQSSSFGVPILPSTPMLTSN